MKIHTYLHLQSAHTTRAFIKLLLCLAWLGIPMLSVAQDSQIEEIIVTAQKREQNIQDVSVSITAFSADDIRDLGIDRPRDLARLTPGLMMNASSISESDPMFTLRGIGMNSSESNQNPSVTPYLDDIALPSHVMLGFQIFDIERIEVLKGPQGTLYGRNTTGGAMKFIARKPAQAFSANASLDYGEYDRMEFEGAVGGGLTDTLSTRLAVSINSQDGWQNLRLGPEAGVGVDRRNGDVDRKSFRGSLLWEPTETLDMLVVGDVASDDSEALAFEHAGNLLNDRSGDLCSFGTIGVRDETQCASFAQRRDAVGGDPLNAAVEVVSDQDGDPRTVHASFTSGNSINAKSWGISSTINWRFESFTITSVTGYRKFNRDFGSDIGASPFIISDNFRRAKIDSVTQEIRLTSNDVQSPWQWLIGGYYSKDDNFDSVTFNYRDHVSFSGFFDSTFTQDTENLAIFGQTEYAINEQLRLIGGIRYTDEERVFTYGGTNVGSGPTPVAAFKNKLNSSEISGKIGIDYSIKEDWLVYASFSRGFKGGGYPSTIAFSVPQLFPFETEELLAYEAGLKTTLADGKLRFNTALYYYDWHDLQASTAVDRAGVRVIVLANAGDARVLGVDSELGWQPLPEFSISLGFNYMDAEITSGEFDGDTPAHTPRFMLSGVARYESTQAMIGDLRPFALLDFSYQDDVEFILANHPGATEEGYGLLNARIGFISADGRWEFAAWARNLTDKLYRSEVFGPGSSFLPGRIHYGAPRMFGVSLNYSL